MSRLEAPEIELCTYHAMRVSHAEFLLKTANEYEAMANEPGLAEKWRVKWQVEAERLRVDAKWWSK